MNPYNQGQPYQPNYPQGFPPPPPPSSWWTRNRTWVILLSLVVLLLVGAVVLARSLAAKFGETVGRAAEYSAQREENNSENEATYENLDAVFSSNPAQYAELKGKTDRLEALSKSINAEVAALRDEYRDSIKGKDLGLFSGTIYSQRFFIQSGRASRLKTQLEKYTAEADLVMALGSAEELGYQYYRILPYRNVYENMNFGRHKEMNWENIHFSGPPISIRTNFTSLLSELHEFEAARLEWITDRVNNPDTTDSVSTEHE